ncbi:aminotransferase class V-fold PLP-dependent enzyme [Aliiroseovarius sp.]|uniref:aminotransferase class V-fold PLP-dependent enzyme n=1 Tax=Aliiroseovarius sp. TaxID=1872442 RepID=UPI003BA91BD4
MSLAAFRTRITTTHAVRDLSAGLIGEGRLIPGPEGDVPLIYADNVASGRALTQVEDFIRDEVLPFYANTHTDASFCGAHTTALREAARAEIARITKAGDAHEVIFTGSGATAGLNRLVHLLGVNRAERPVVFIGPYEHHSNILPWRESRAEVVEIPEAPEGGPDLEALARALHEHGQADLKIGAFSAASNVTGIITDPDPVIDLLRAHGALAVWDYAGAGPYLNIDATRMDAIAVSPHKFPGGPGASGVLILRKEAVRARCPSWPGGGTVSFVSPWRHDYVDDLAAREEAGTPNIVGDIRAGLAFLVKEAVGEDTIAAREAQFRAMAEAAWGANPQITILGADKPHRLPIFSLIIRDGAGEVVSPQLFTRMLSDLYGIQARGGCACAGPYGHRLLGIEQAQSQAIHDALAAGDMVEKPGWTRLNFTYLDDTAKVARILDAITELTAQIDQHRPKYAFDPASGQWSRRAKAA